MIRCISCHGWFKDFDVLEVYPFDYGNLGPGYVCEDCLERIEENIRMEGL